MLSLESLMVKMMPSAAAKRTKKIEITREEHEDHEEEVTRILSKRVSSTM